MAHDTEKQPITDSQEFLVITQYYHALVSELEKASQQRKDQELIYDIQLALKKMPKIHDSMWHWYEEVYHPTIRFWEITGRGRSTNKIGLAIHDLTFNVEHFQSNNPKHSGDVEPKDELVSKQVTSLMFYGCLCSIYNYLEKLPNKFKRDETNAMKNFLTYLETFRKGLFVFLHRHPKTHLGVQKINRALDRDVLYPLQTYNSYTILHKYLPYNDGNLFDDLAEAEKHSYHAFTSGIDGCTELMGHIDPIFKLLSFTENKQVLVTQTMELYFKYVLHFLDKGLAKSHIIVKNAKTKNALMQAIYAAKAKEQTALAQLATVTKQPPSVQLQMAMEYITTKNM